MLTKECLIAAEARHRGRRGGQWASRRGPPTDRGPLGLVEPAAWLSAADFCGVGDAFRRPLPDTRLAQASVN